jgi:hypothetical protein
MPRRAGPDAAPVAPETIRVNGDFVRAQDPAWSGLDLARAMLRDRSIWGDDHHLDTPWCHPSDQPHGWEDGIRYRVRPRWRSHRFEKRDDGWWVVRGRGR